MKILIYSLIISLLVIFSCKKKENTPQPENEVWLLYKRFNPNFIEIKRGTTLIFINKDNANHSITESGGAFSSGKIKTGDQFTQTFNDSTSYGIYCSYHPDNLSEQISISVK